MNLRAGGKRIYHAQNVYGHAAQVIPSLSKWPSSLNAREGASYAYVD